MLTTIGAIKLSKKDWKIVTNILFVFPITVILFLIKGTIGIVRWIINSVTNSQHKKSKTSKHPPLPEKNTENWGERPFQDNKTIFVVICVALLIIGIIMSAVFNNVNSKEQNGTGDKTEINDSTQYTDFAFNEVEGGYQMTQSYKLFSHNYEGELVIPETYNGKPVVEIDGMNSWFGRGITKLIGSKNLMVIRHATLASRDQSPMPNMTEVIFPADGKLKLIETHAFYWQNSLKTVVLPSQFEHFEDGVFERCFALENLVIYNTIPPQMEGDIFNSDGNLMNDEKWHTKPNKNFIVYVPDDAVETYIISIWGKYTIKPISEADFIK